MDWSLRYEFVPVNTAQVTHPAVSNSGLFFWGVVALVMVYRGGVVELQSIVFDSPVKTVGDTKRALSVGVRMNIDNLVELARLRKVHDINHVAEREC